MSEEIVNDEIFIDTLEKREKTFEFLSRLFRVEADQDLLDNMLKMKFPAKSENKDVEKGYSLIRKFLGTVDANSLTDLAIDYVRTFIGSGNDGFSAAYPFESVYTSPKRLMMQDSRDEVLVIYHAAGLEKQESWKEGEDHIALELEFIAILTKRAIKAYKDGDEERCAYLMLQQKNFIEDHIKPWFPMLAEDMRKFSNTDFYTGLAYLTEGVIKQDHEFLDELIEDDGEEAEGGKVVHMEVDISPIELDIPTKQDVQDALDEAEAAEKEKEKEAVSAQIQTCRKDR